MRQGRTGGHLSTLHVNPGGPLPRYLPSVRDPSPMLPTSNFVLSAVSSRFHFFIQFIELHSHSYDCKCVSSLSSLPVMTPYRNGNSATPWTRQNVASGCNESEIRGDVSNSKRLSRWGTVNDCHHNGVENAVHVACLIFKLNCTLASCYNYCYGSILF